MMNEDLLNIDLVLLLYFFISYCGVREGVVEEIDYQFVILSIPIVVWLNGTVVLLAIVVVAGPVG